jgi:opacity protein-like surface antigen
MRSVKFWMAAGAASLLSSAAFAADMPIAPPPQYYAPPPVEDFGGWYLRGDIGFSNQKVKHLDNVNDALNFTSHQNLGFSSAGIYGLGVGYQVNNWFRADVTGEYRGNSTFNGRDQITYNGGLGVDTYTASKSEILFLANAYVDLGTWWCVTPFIGAGVGTARVTVANFIDQGIALQGGPALPSTALADTASKWNLAYAVHAGLGYKISPNVTMELAYRYVNMGSGVTRDLVAFDGSANYGPMTFKDITSHDVKLGIRWNLDSPPAYAPPPPLIRKG